MYTMGYTITSAHNFHLECQCCKPNVSPVADLSNSIKRFEISWDFQVNKDLKATVAWCQREWQAQFIWQGWT